MINEIIKVNSKYKERVSSYIDKKELFIKPNFKPLVVEDFFEWKFNVELSKTEEIYVHSLLIIKDLIKKSLNSNDDFSDYGYQIIENWWEKNQDNKIAWNEHAVAERTLNLIYFQENSTKKIKKKKYELILDQHLAFLFDSANYKPNNHGLMMDRSLLVGSHYSNNIVYRERAIDRFNVFIYRDFSRAGVHLENSPEYHSLALKIVQEFTFILKEMEIEMNNDINTIIKKAELYIPRITRPDKTIPLLGDSGHRKLIGKKTFGNLVDHVSGVFLYQDMINYNWLLVSNGYQSTTHKHKDDMSVQFSIDSLNILVDSGKYNYDISSEVRKYLISDKAHSKPYILNKRYKYDGKERLKTNIVLNTTDFYHIETSYLKPRDFHILRNVVLHKETSTLLIIDRFSSSEDLVFISNFVLNPDLSLNIINNNTLQFLDTNYSMVTKGSINNIISKESEKENWYSSTFNKYERTNRLFLRSAGKFKTHITYFKMDNTKVEVTTTKENINLAINKENYSINVSKIERW